ncbi:hypothetical protein M2T82_12030 [Elizabethkingia ursingii]|uniref:hypothetical protein n=1 Tax=Elizabethkingia ursingii TaxID=1756150 RepID=UPI002011B3BF|nr:hypothetical protein [Elizabethkingia ursingii]MCL1668793.1 hypothetical protein [Elizabethkingia ursingii]
MEKTEIVKQADILFSSNSFLERETLPPLKPSMFNILATTTSIPVVSEWTNAKSEYLVFNCLDSCLGIIALSKDKSHLLGYHFSMDFEKIQEIKTQVDSTVDKLKEEQYDFFSFGGSQKDWIKLIKVNLTGVKAIEDDANQYNWYFSIKKNKIDPYKWKTPKQKT